MRGGFRSRADFACARSRSRGELAARAVGQQRNLGSQRHSTIISQRRTANDFCVALFHDFGYGVDVQFNYLLKRTFAFLLIFLAVSIPAQAQEKTVSSPIAMPESSNQPNTAAGLRQLLEAMLEAARHDDLAKLAALVKDTEVPDCALWLHSMYRSDHADSWMGLCDQKFRGPDEKLFIEQLVELARQDGRLLIRSVNDDPEPGKGMEWGMLESLQRPLDIYSAGWETSENPEGERIGYFMFIDGGFRWDSRHPFVKIRIANFKIDPAKLVTKVGPV